MRNLLNNPIFVSVLVIGAIAGSYYTLRPESRTVSNPGRLASAQENEEEETSDDSQYVKTSNTSALDALARLKIDRNAFSLLSKKDEEPVEEDGAKTVEERISVVATWIQPNDRLAALDDLIVYEGQRVRKAFLQKIEVAGVWLRHEEQLEFVPVGESFAYRYAIE